jgi:KaiC/GvpD/RAD55 family RecA-like ATPase
LVEFLESHVRQLYRLLGHGDCDNYTDLRCIKLDNNKVVDRSIVRGEQAVVDWARRFNGKGNCFIGRASRNEDGSVYEFSTVTADIDSDRERNTAATVGQMQIALIGAREILRRYPGGYLATSGNGALIIYRLPSPIKEGFKQFETGFKGLEEELRKCLQEGVKLDATYDSARLVKLLGTVSTKGDSKMWRVSRFIDVPSPPFRRNRILERIRAYATSFSPETKSESFANTVYASRSESDFALAVHYQKAGLSREDTLKALRKHVLGRNDREDDHKRIVDKVFGDQEVIAIQEGLKIPLRYSTPDGGLEDHKARLLERNKFSEPEMGLGLSVIDKHTWGLRRGEIFTIAARPGIGKTSIAISITARLARQGKRILFFTSEMSIDSTYDRLLQVLSGLSGDKFTTGSFTDDDRKRLDTAYEELKGFGIRLALCDACSPDINQVKKIAYEVKPDLLIYDHIQHIGGESDGARANVSKFIRGLKDISRELGCAVLALSQIRRLLKDLKTGKEVRPTLSDLKESGTIEEESGAVLLLSVLSEEPDSPIRCLYSELAKNRYGPITVVGVEFNKFTAHFKDLEGIG